MNPSCASVVKEFYQDVDRLLHDGASCMPVMFEGCSLLISLREPIAAGDIYYMPGAADCGPDLFTCASVTRSWVVPVTGRVHKKHECFKLLAIGSEGVS